MVKNSPANVQNIRNVGSIPRWGRSPGGEHGNPLQYSCLENAMDRGAWWATVYRVTKSQTQLKWLHTKVCQYRRHKRRGFSLWVEKIPWSRKWQPTPVFLLGNSMDRGAWQAIVHKVTKSWTKLNTHTHTHTNNNKSNREYLVQIFILPFFFWLLLQSVESSARWCTSPSFSAQF